MRSENEAMNKSHVLLITTVHPRTDTRVFSRVAPFLASDPEISLSVVVADGQGAEDRGTFVIEDIGSPGRGRLGRMTTGLILAAREILRRRPHILHLVDPELLLLAPLARSIGIAVVYEAHEDLAADVRDKHWLPVVARPAVSVFAARTLRILLRWTDGLVANTPSIARSLHAFDPVVIANYPVLSATPADKRADRDTVLTCVYVGGITRIRGLTELVRAIELINQNRPAKLLLAGPVSPPAYLDELRTEPGWKRVEYIGSIPNSDVPALYARADIGCITFLPAPNHVDAQPNKMYEYMASGLPIVASDFPQWKTLIDSGPFGKTCDPTSPTSIADTVITIAEDARFARLCAERGPRATADHYNWASESRKLANLYVRLKRLRPMPTGSGTKS